MSNDRNTVNGPGPDDDDDIGMSLEDSSPGFNLDDAAAQKPQPHDTSALLFDDDDDDSDVELAPKPTPQRTTPRPPTQPRDFGREDRPLVRPIPVPDDDDDHVELAKPAPLPRRPAIVEPPKSAYPRDRFTGRPVTSPALVGPSTEVDDEPVEQPAARHERHSLPDRDNEEIKKSQVKSWIVLGLIALAAILFIVFVLWVVNRSFGSAAPAQTAAAANAAQTAAGASPATNVAQANTAAPAAAHASGSTNGNFEFAKNTKTRGEYASTGVDLPTDSFIKQSKELMVALAAAQADVTALQKELALEKAKAVSLGASETLLKAEVVKLNGEAAALRQQLSEEQKKAAAAASQLSAEQTAHQKDVAKFAKEMSAARVLLATVKAQLACCEEKVPDPVQVKVENFITVPVKDSPIQAPAPAPKPPCVVIPPKCCK